MFVGFISANAFAVPYHVNCSGGGPGAWTGTIDFDAHTADLVRTSSSEKPTSFSKIKIGPIGSISGYMDAEPLGADLAASENADSPFAPISVFLGFSYMEDVKNNEVLEIDFFLKNGSEDRTNCTFRAIQH